MQVTNHIQQWLFQRTCYLVVWRFFFFFFLSCVAQQQRLSLLMYKQPRISSRTVTFILMLGKPTIFLSLWDLLIFLFDKQTKESTNWENKLFITIFPVDKGLIRSTTSKILAIFPLSKMWFRFNQLYHIVVSQIRWDTFLSFFPLDKELKTACFYIKKKNGTYIKKNLVN